MTSYVYNPSKKVTEILSNYLEFDPAQLELAIWSGNLSLCNVQLRPEAIEPLLSGKIASKSSPTSTKPDDDEHLKFIKPPLAFKVVQSKIGSLSMKIPWKRLVWGQGDVQVNVENVTIVLAVESRCHFFGNELATDSDEDVPQPPVRVSRDKKQKWIREAEKRLLQGKALGPWLNALRYREIENDMRKEQATAVERVNQNMGIASRWLRGITTDFLWRFFVGLQCDIQNVKIIFLQDNIQVGINLPSSKITALPDNNDPSPANKLSSSREDKSDTADSHSIPQATNEDGVHLNKIIKQIGVGIYVREIPGQYRYSDRPIDIADVLTSDYVLRPVDFDFRLSIFFPQPSDKSIEKSKTNQPTRPTPVDEATVEETSSTTSSTRKRRRGKREKMPSQTDTNTSNPLETATVAINSSTLSTPSDKKRFLSSSLSSPSLPKPPILGRSATAFAAHAHRNTALPRPSTQRENVTSLPLAQPDDIAAFYAAASSKQDGSVARVDGNLTVGAVQMICSSRHYLLINTFLASCARVRNGRPSKNIDSILDRSHFTSSNSNADLSSCPDSDDKEAQRERADVISSWWQYVLGVLLWEIRQRRRLRKLFQKRCLSFSWKRQTYRRAEYVELYVATHLRRRSTDPILQQKLMGIEDEISVEQVLLYRSIARAVHVRGEEMMPMSVLQMKMDGKSTKVKNIDENQLSPGKVFAVEEEDDWEMLSRSFLSTLEERCEVTRARCNADNGSEIPTLEPFLGRSHFASTAKLGLDIISVGLVSGTTRSRQSNKSKLSVTTAAIKQMRSQGSSSGFLFSFAFCVEKVQFFVIENETAENYSSGREVMVSAYEESSRLSHSSNISILTDDERFFIDQGDGADKLIQGTSEKDQVSPWKDYLVFKRPTNNFFHLSLSPLNFSATFRTGGSRNFNFIIGGIHARGVNETKLLEIGSDTFDDKDVPVPAVELVINKDEKIPKSYIQESSQSAFALSLVDEKKKQNILQCDTPTIRAWFDPSSTKKLVFFFRREVSLYPNRLLEKTFNEEIRLRVLRQSKVPMISLNSSIRLRGFEFRFPMELHEMAYEYDRDSKSGQPRFRGATIQCEMIELYSGFVAENLHRDDTRSNSDALSAVSSEMYSVNKAAMTRQLAMLDVSGLLDTRRTAIGSKWIVTMSGLDMDLCQGAQFPLKIFQQPVDIECIAFVNSNSLQDSDNGICDVVAKISALDIIVSHERMSMIVNNFQEQIQGSFSKKEASDNGHLPPRFEVLSSFIHLSMEVSASRTRISLLSHEHDPSPSIVSKKISMEEVLTQFLRVAFRFDFAYPLDDALSAALQICLDRLVAIGLTLEESREAANSALMHFYGDGGKTICTSEVTDDERDVLGADDADSERYQDKLIKKSVQRTLTSFDEILNSCISRGDGFNREDLIIDLADGFDLTLVSLFYDSHFGIGIPSVCVANGEGVQLMMITRPQSAENMAVETENDGASASGIEPDEMDDLSSARNHNRECLFGIYMQRFTVDKNNKFGRGGLPLQILGRDSQNSNESEYRHRESLNDLELGVVDFMFSCELFHSAIRTLKKSFSIVGNASDKPSRDEARDSCQINSEDSFVFVTCHSVTALFVSDCFAPFARILVGEMFTQVANVVTVSKATTYCFGAKSFVVLNLTTGGERFSSVICEWPDMDALCLQGNYTDDSSLHVILTGLRIIVLRQFIYECLQYFVSDRYGFGRLLKFIKEDSLPKKKTSAFRFLVTAYDSSVILPRSSLDLDMVCVEVREATFESSLCNGTFSVPDSNCTEHVDRYVVKEEVHDESKIVRKHISLRGFRVFTSIADWMGSDPVVDSSAFRFFFEIMERPKTGERVYSPISLDGDLEVDDSLLDSKRVHCVWQEITTSSSSLDIIIDFAPHMRILITDDSDFYRRDGLNLNLRLSQFCLLLSLWYSNMQELPVMFPFSAVELETGSGINKLTTKFPDFASDDFRQFLLKAGTLTSEVVIDVKSLSMKCTFDRDYVENIDMEVQGINFCFHSLVVHITADDNGVTRIGCGSSKAIMTDQTKNFANVLTTAWETKSNGSWADLKFGLERRHCDVTEPLSMALQLSVFMVPGWSIYNLGLDSTFFCMSDLTTVTTFLEFLTSYGSNPKFKNPLFDATDQIKQIKASLSVGTDGSSTAEPTSSSSIDFRLWLVKPTLSIPHDSLSFTEPGIRIAPSGFWLKYTAIDSLSSIECISSGLVLIYDDICIAQSCQKLEDMYGRSLIENLSLGLRFNSDTKSKHSDVVLRIPFLDADACGISSPPISASPTVFHPPTICTPLVQPTRSLGHTICEISCIIELIPKAWSILVSFFEGDQKSSITSVPPTDQTDEKTFSLVANVCDLRFFVLDPVLGRHLPITVLSLKELSITSSKFYTTPYVIPCLHGDNPPEDLQVSVDGHFWAEYFKLGLTRSWEPLIEAYKFNASYEISRFRGTGLSYYSDSPLHVNISSALLVVLDEVLEYVKHSTQSANRDKFEMCSKRDGKPVASSDQCLIADSILGKNVLHEKPNLLEKGRIAFSLRNMTGQKIRILRQVETHDETESFTMVTYLNHAQAVKLNFSPSISLVDNLKVVEVAYPGMPNSFRSKYLKVPPHTVDLQIPGYQWLEGIAVDTFGRSFAQIVPASLEIQAKMEADWHLANALKLLVEVGLESGGRQVTVRSIFSVVNKTTHGVRLFLSPDVSRKPGDAQGRIDDYDSEVEYPLIEPGSSYQIPSLLLESGLRQPGSHLGSLWLKPETCYAGTQLFQSYAESSEKTLNLLVDFCSKAIQLAKLVSESAYIFERSRGEDIPSSDASTGLQISCPVLQESGDRLAPFCYVVEVGRSPLVKTDSPDETRLVHGPVAYTLSVHPPLVIVNLLPERGRFELMHAVRHNVLWFGDLDAGQKIEVHSVGLDAPLLLCINLGFAKTPVHEGALVHHGNENSSTGVRGGLGGLKTIGKAGRAVTMQIGKTLTSIGESPDLRGKKILSQDPLSYPTQGKTRKKFVEGRKDDLFDETDVADISNVDGQTYRMDTGHFSPQDIATETSVIDGLGQRLSLQIENIRGGGGQRRISVYCPYWMVNTTEHCLRYRQENSKVFVSGTIISPEKNGSLPVSGGRARATYETQLTEIESNRRGTIFSGMPGALATFPGKCDLAPDKVAELVDKNLSLEQMASLAFMFNFHGNNVATSISNNKVCVQLGDGTGKTPYESDWSRGVNLDSVGIPQTVGMHCKDGRVLEVTMIVSVAPGILSSFTKIVRFLPQYIVVNTLSYPVRIWQDCSTSYELDYGGERSRWRYKTKQSKRYRSKVNQYEALWGRETRLDDRGNDLSMSGTSARKTAVYITTVLPNEFMPFCLPDTRRERQFRVDIGKPWGLTPSFPADVAGGHVLKITQAIDIRLLPHVSTRSNPHYEVKLPPDDRRDFCGELGVWFETEWGESKSLIIKSVKKHSYAFNETDIHVGDELVEIDGINVSQLSFVEAMSLLKTRLSEVASASRNLGTSRRIFNRRQSRHGRFHEADELVHAVFEITPVILIFRTIEERLRRVRIKAARASGELIGESPSESSSLLANSQAPVLPNQHMEDSGYVHAELATTDRSDAGMFLVIRENPSIPFQIQNRTIKYTIFYRQKGCNHHDWQSLKPGQSKFYSWEEPMKIKRLTLRVASETAFQFRHDDPTDPIGDEIQDTVENVEQGVLKVRRKLKKVEDEEDVAFSPSVNVHLEEVGFHGVLPVLTSLSKKVSQKYLTLDVDVEGPTRILLVRESSGDMLEQQIKLQIEHLKDEVQEEEQRLTELRMFSVFPAVSDANETHAQIKNQVQKSKTLMSDFSGNEIITKCHQVSVEVLEAVGLNCESFGGSCNPYAEIRLQAGSSERLTICRRRDLRRTYFIRKSVNPKWLSQVFVFDLPSDSVDTTCGYSFQVNIRNFRAYGSHPVVGKARIQLHSIRNQEPLVGWFPLAGRVGRRELENHASHWGRGSLKLRVQWIHSAPALIHYFSHLSEQRLRDIQDCLKILYRQRDMEYEANEKKRAENDGFKAVRIVDLLRTSRLRPPNEIQERRQARTSVAKKLKDSLPTPSEKTFPKHEVKTMTLPNIARVLNHEKVHFAAFARAALAVQRNRRKLDNVKSAGSKHKFWPSFDRVSPVDGDIASFPVTTFKNWITMHILFQDEDLRKEAVGDIIKIGLRQSRQPSRHVRSFRYTRSTSENIVAQKLSLPCQAPLLMQAIQHTFIEKFIMSRNSFEREATRALRSAVNPGGWLTIRPITALNLPETYAGMFVKVRHGSIVLMSQSVDARVCPVWSTNQAERNASTTSARTSGRISKKQNPTEVNDLHIHVAPQMTSGSMRISVVGERGSKKLKTRTELGVLYLPLGSAIAACIDAAESSRLRMDLSVQTYTRWFPLTNPRDAIPVEGDGGLSVRPQDTEKESDHLFKEYFAPCIQLSLIWDPHPDENDYTGNNSEKMKTEDTLMCQNRDTIPTTLVKNYFNADIGRLTAALIDSQKACELLSVNISDIDLRYWVTNAKTRVGLTIGWLQVDFQDDDAREAVVLAPTPTGNLVPTIQVLAVKDNIRSASSTLSFDFIDVSIAELDLTVEEILLFDVFDFLSSVNVHRRVKPHSKSSQENSSHVNHYVHHNFWTDNSESVSYTPLSEEFSTHSNENAEQRRVYIKQIVLGQFKVNFSYLKGKKITNEAPGKTERLDQFFVDAGRELFQQRLQHFLIGEEKLDVFLLWSRNAGMDDRGFEDERGRDVRNFAVFLATILPNVSDAPVRLPGKSVNHVFSNPMEIAKNIFNFYRGESLKQIYKIIGSLDIVGNPTMLFTSVYSGVKDLVVTPSKALWNSPTDPSSVGLGVAQGTLSFVSHGTSGFFGTLAKVAAAAGQGVAVLSLDHDFRDWHHNTVVVETTNLNRVWKRRGLKSVRQMLTQPLVDILGGIAYGIFGAILSPYKGYKRHGKHGIARGVVVGTAGLIARPVVGIIDSFAHFTASIHDIAKSVNILDKRLQPALRLRLPHTFGLKGILTPYDYGVARAAWLLKRFPRRSSLNSKISLEENVIHVEILPSVRSHIYAIATSLRVLLIKVQTLSSGSLNSSLCWEADLSDKASTSSKVTDHGHSGVALYLMLKQKGKPIIRDGGDGSEVDVFSPAAPSANDLGKNEEESTRSIGLTTPEERLSNSAREDFFDYGTDKSMEGDLLEWFTISADYQYRRQLIRLHNAISCITGKFDALISDSTIRMKGNTEGYTSFGIFHFEPQRNEKIPCKEALDPAALAYLPWANETTFEKLQQQNPDEQKIALSNRTANWSFEQELRELEREGGPEWLTLAFARATFVHLGKVVVSTKPLLSTIDGKANPFLSPDPFRKLSWAEKNRLATIEDGDFESDRIDSASEFDKRLSHVYVGIGAEDDSYGQLSLNDDEAGAFLDADQQKVEMNGMTAADKRKLSTPSHPSFSGSDTTSVYSFRTARMTESQGRRLRSSGQVAEEITESFVTAQSTPGRPLLLKSSSSDDNGLKTEANDETEDHSVRLNPRRDPLLLRPTDDRLQRMERLMEQLLIFSSEQALRSQQPSDHVMTLSAEIADLRAQIKKQTNTTAVVEELRAEVAFLRAQKRNAAETLAPQTENPHKTPDSL